MLSTNKFFKDAFWWKITRQPSNKFSDGHDGHFEEKQEWIDGHFCWLTDILRNVDGQAQIWTDIFDGHFLLGNGHVQRFLKCPWNTKPMNTTMNVFYDTPENV